ncbi:MAG: hypothetical protein Tsb002_38100 [Wenzhouxiangellaceae bacterium]
MTWHDVIFFLVFASQIVVISVLICGRLLRRIRRLLEQYPATEYPRLYPRPQAEYWVRYALLRFYNRAVIVLGVGLLVALMLWIDHGSFADDGAISEFWPVFYAALQIVPILYLSHFEMKHTRLIRQYDPRRQRSASLQPRRLFDFVSPLLFSGAVLLMMATIAFDFYAHDFIVDIRHDSLQRTISLLIANLYMAGWGWWMLRGSRTDPHLATHDRYRLIAVQLHSMVMVSIVISLLFITEVIDDLYSLDAFEASLISVFFQTVVYLGVGVVMKQFRLEDIDFSGYRDDASTAQQALR